MRAYFQQMQNDLAAGFAAGGLDTPLPKAARRPRRAARQAAG
jgi:hypothetical protein